MSAPSLVRRFFANPREGRLRAGWRLLLGLVVYVAASLIAAILTAGVASVVATVLPAVSPDTFPRMVATYILLYVVLVGLLVLLARYVDRRLVPDIGLGGDGWWSNLGVGLLLGVAMTTAVFAVELAAGLIAIRGVFVTRPGLDVVAGTSFPVALALTAATFVAVGVGEEVVIRGYLMTNLAEGLNGLGPIGARGATAVAALVTSALFGASHFMNPDASLVSAVNITVVGLFLAAAYVATDDLGVPIGIHIAWNFSLSSVYGFPVSGLTTPATIVDVRQTGPELVTGGGFGPEAGLVVYLALAVAVAVTWWWVRREEGAVRFRESVAVPDLRRTPGREDS